MRAIPPAALLLGLLGFVPFLWGALCLYSPALTALGQDWLGARFVGPYVQLYYGALICVSCRAFCGALPRARKTAHGGQRLRIVHAAGPMGLFHDRRWPGQYRNQPD